jgi:hypothetical protein
MCIFADVVELPVHARASLCRSVAEGNRPVGIAEWEGDRIAGSFAATERRGADRRRPLNRHRHWCLPWRVDDTRTTASYCGLPLASVRASARALRQAVEIHAAVTSWAVFAGKRAVKDP